MLRLLLISAILLPLMGMSQDQGAIWVCGNGNILDFNGVSPVVSGDDVIDLLDSEIEGTSSISNEDGLLLFYSDGRRVWDWNHELVVDTLLGHQSATHASYIIPVPDTSTVYYLITVDAAQNDLSSGLRYSVVHACRENGVWPLQSNLSLSGNMSEKVVGIKHATGYWLVAHGYNSDAYKVWNVSSSGFGDVAVYNTGPVHQHANPNSSNAAIGQIKATPDGKYLASAITNSVRLIDVASFDTLTGNVSSLVTFAPDSTELGFPNGTYGLSFSSNSRFLYTSSLSEYKVWQYDMDFLPSDVQGFLDSRSLVYSSINETPGIPNSFQQLQLGPNGMIYLNNLGNQYLSVIPFPNEVAPSCGFQDSAVSLMNPSTYGLPSFVDSYAYSASGVCKPDGVEQLVESIVEIYPNPATDHTVLSLPESAQFEVQITDQFGRVVYHQGFDSAQPDGTFQLNTSSWPQGIYAITATGQDGFRYTGRLVVCRNGLQ